MRGGFQRLYERQLKTKSLAEAICVRKREPLGPVAWVIELEKADKSLHTDDHRVRLTIGGALGLFTLLTEQPDSASYAWSRAESVPAE